MISSSFFFPLPIARIIAPCSRAVLLLLALPHLPQVNAQTSAVVHQFNITVAEKLKTELSINDRSKNVMSEFSVKTALPEELVDSMTVDAERALTQKLDFPVHMCWTKGRRNTDADSFIDPQLIGLPNNTFKLAKKYYPNKTRFIELNCMIAADKSISIGERKKLKLKKVKLKDLDTLHTNTEYHRPVKTKTAETLRPYNIYDIYHMALAELMRQ